MNDKIRKWYEDIATAWKFMREQHPIRGTEEAMDQLTALAREKAAGDPFLLELLASVVHELWREARKEGGA